MVQASRSGPTSDDPLAYLLGLQRFGIKLGLDNMEALKAGLDDPDRCFRSILIAGTNGKGSVAAMVERGLRAAGCCTGLYTSPHLIALNERFAVNGRPVDDAALALEAASIRGTIERLRRCGGLAHPPTFFEATTALALSLFRRRGVDVAVLEVGMGGRFDATNTVGALAAGIPSIDLDHQQYLGATLGEIAFEKAGVIKPGATVVSAERKPEAREVLRRRAAAVRAHFVDAVDEVAIRSHEEAGRIRIESLETPRARYGPLTLALRGRHQLRNAAVAVRLLEELAPAGIRVPRAAVEQALADARWRGRIELVDCAPGRRLLLDPAHNAAAAAALGAYVAGIHPSGLPFVFRRARRQGPHRHAGGARGGGEPDRLRPDRQPASKVGSGPGRGGARRPRRRADRIGGVAGGGPPRRLADRPGGGSHRIRIPGGRGAARAGQRPAAQRGGALRRELVEPGRMGRNAEPARRFGARGRSADRAQE